jgi:hypothetical protein
MFCFVELLALLQTEQRKLWLRRSSKSAPCIGPGPDIGCMPAVLLRAAALLGWRLLGLCLLCLLTTITAAAVTAVAMPATISRDRTKLADIHQ